MARRVLCLASGLYLRVYGMRAEAEHETASKLGRTGEYYEGSAVVTPSLPPMNQRQVVRPS